MNPLNDDDCATLFEVAPRDGLQSLEGIVPTASKIKLIDELSLVGFRKIEATSFVSPKWVPQLGDAAEVMRAIKRNPAVSYSCLTPNLQGLDRAIEASADEVAIFASSSEGFSLANLNCSIAESLERYRPLVQHALKNQLPVRGYVSTIFACPFDGPTPAFQVLNVSRELLNMGCYAVSLGDTIGAGDADAVSTLLDVLLDEISPDKLAGHFHDTNRTALEMIEVCANRGLRTFDSSVAGLGGCPYAPGATGNVDTRKVVTLLEGMGLNTGIDFDVLARAEETAAIFK